MSQHNDQIFLSRLNQHPQLRERVETLLNVVENTAGNCTTADDAEQYVIEELRKMGNDALHCWANAIKLRKKSLKTMLFSALVKIEFFRCRSLFSFANPTLTYQSGTAHKQCSQLLK